MPRDDDTVILRRTPRRTPRVLIAGLLVAILAAGAVVAWLLRPPPAQPLPPLATETAILGRSPSSTEAYRFAPQPSIIVIQFATLAEQAATLNRAAALLERAATPRDRVLDPAELDRLIRAAGDVPERVYLGHDYRAADLERFFRLAGPGLTPNEAWLRDRLRDWGWRPGGSGALITLVREDQAAGIDPATRATILRHELSHGLYFVDAGYAEYARRFWAATLSEQERVRLRQFLASEGYDPAIDDLMANEAQAYLVHTTDPRFFGPAAVGMTQARLDALRTGFLAGMPPGWLRNGPAPPARAPRRRQRLGAVRTRRTLAATGPARRACSMAARSSVT